MNIVYPHHLGAMKPRDKKKDPPPNGVTGVMKYFIDVCNDSKSAINNGKNEGDSIDKKN